MIDVPILILLACLATGAPLGVCRAEVSAVESNASNISAENYDCCQTRGGCIALPPWDDLSWVTPKWPLYAAHIVASESRGVPEADIVIACTLIRDVVEGGYGPFELHLGRWKGWGSPDEKDEEAVYKALLTAACVHIPKYRFVGNFRDVQYWRSIGMIDEGPYDLFVGARGQAVVGVPK